MHHHVEEMQRPLRQHGGSPPPPVPPPPPPPSMSALPFLSKASLARCETIFTRYMSHKYGLDVTGDVRKLRSTLFREMSAVHRTHPTAPHTQLYNLSLSRARNAFLAESGGGGAVPPLIERERQVFGHRRNVVPPVADVDRPRMSDAPLDDAAAEAQLQRMLAARREMEEPPLPPAEACPPPPDDSVHRDKLTHEDFAEAIASYAQQAQQQTQDQLSPGGRGGGGGGDHDAGAVAYPKGTPISAIAGDGDGEREEEEEEEQQQEEEAGVHGHGNSNDDADAEAPSQKEGHHAHRITCDDARLYGQRDVVAERFVDAQAVIPTQQQLLADPSLAASPAGMSAAVLGEAEAGHVDAHHRHPHPHVSASSAPVGPALTRASRLLRQRRRRRGGKGGGDEGPSSSSLDEDEGEEEGKGTGGDAALMIREPPRTEVLRYLCVNGFDRDWTVEPYRYRFTARLTEGSTRFRDITAIQATSLIIPAEIRHGAARLSQVTPDFVPDKPSYEHSFSFSYPYVSLVIDELDSVYEGTNDNVRRAFCQFKYQRHYQAPNGRGYVQLDPLQHEIKRFSPAPLGALRQLSLSVRKPNGTLFNTSRDAARLRKVEYQAYQPSLLHVVLEHSFDRNEFYVADTVVLRARLVAEDAKGGSEDAFAQVGQVEELRRFEAWLNRPEGHEIVELGDTTAADRHQGFYVYAPGALDQDSGELELDEAALAALSAYNRGIDDNGGIDGGARSAPLGQLMNFSLQTTLFFKVWMSHTDTTAMFRDDSSVRKALRGAAFPSMLAELS